MSTLSLYLHTHWDREWYLPFESFRAHLVPVVERVLHGLECGDLPFFYLDGQAVVLEDACQLEPAFEPRIRALLKAGKLAAGPWYVLADQMLVSGESLIGNLRLGLETTYRFGLPAMIGYCPDTFGHSQDLPRILRGFAIDKAVVWRGVPCLPGGPAFRWQAPDNSSVTAFHLTRGYYQSVFHENRPADELGANLLTWLLPETQSKLDSPYLALLDGALMPIGCDHLGPPEQFEQTLCQVKDVLDKKGGHKLLVVDLASWLQDLEKICDGHMPVLTGELRDNSSAQVYGNAYLLPGVLSSRLYLKRENRQAEHRLISMSQAYYTMVSQVCDIAYPRNELSYAWRLLLANHPHDSICGCSVDAVHDEMQTRSKKLNQLLDALDARFDAHFAARETGQPAVDPDDPEFAANQLAIFNLSGHAARGPVKLAWAAPCGQEVKSACVQVISRTKREQLFGGFSRVPYYRDVDLLEAWIAAPGLPGAGYSLNPWPLTAPGKKAVVSTSGRLENEWLSVNVTTGGGLVVRSADGIEYELGHLFADVADGGDTYNFDPLPDDRPLNSVLKSVEPGLSGPLVGSLKLVYEIDIPVGVEQVGSEKRRSKETRRQVIHTEIQLRQGLPILFFESTWENRCRDHRLEVKFNTGKRVLTTFSENHFSLVARNHDKSEPCLPVPTGTEAIPDRFPCQRFFIANEQIFLNFGLPEYGADENWVCLTTLRAVSLLSAGPLRTRGGGAGPHLPVDGANCLGLNRAVYGWAPLPKGKSSSGNQTIGTVSGGSLDDEQRITAYQLAEEFEGRSRALLCRRENDTRSHSFFYVNNSAIRISTLYKSGNELVLRLLNVSSTDQECLVGLGFSCQSVKKALLNEEPLPPALKIQSSAGSHSVTVKFAPNELVTLLIEPDAIR